MYKISVIVPVYNNEEYIVACINSIVGQSVFKEMEIIVINDGSTDASRERLKMFENYENITIIDKCNEGSGIARNVGIDVAKGEFLMFVDGDDRLAASDIAEVLYNAAIENQVNICSGNFVRLINGRLIDRYEKRRKFLAYSKEGVIPIRDIQFPYGHQRYIFKTDYIRGKNIRYTSYKRGQDATFCADALANDENMFHLNRNVYIYRTSQKKVKFSLQKSMDYMHSFIHILELADKMNWTYMADNAAFEMRIFCIKTMYAQMTRDDWGIIDEANACIDFWNHGHKKKLKRLLAYESFKAKGIAYWKQYLEVNICRFRDKIFANLVYLFFSKPDAVIQ